MVKAAVFLCLPSRLELTPSSPNTVLVIIRNLGKLDHAARFVRTLRPRHEAGLVRLEIAQSN